jgi:cell division protein FtsX
MLKLKNTAVILTGALALTAVAPLVAAAAAPASSAEQVKEVKQVTPDNEILNAIKDIEKFISWMATVISLMMPLKMW